MVPAEEMEKRLAKQRAFQMGLAAASEEEFMAWMEDKWVHPYGVKLQALYFQAITNTSILDQYNAACVRFMQVNLATAKRFTIGVSKTCFDRITTLVAALNVALPDNVDFSPTKVIHQQPSSAEAGGKPRKDLFKRQINASAKLLVAARNLLNYLCDLAASPAGSEGAMDFYYLATAEFYKTIKGLPDGHCHLEVHKALNGKLRLLQTRRE